MMQKRKKNELSHADSECNGTFNCVLYGQQYNMHIIGKYFLQRIAFYRE